MEQGQIGSHGLLGDKGARILLVAVHPDYQGKGVNALLFTDLIPIYQRKGVQYAETNPELAANAKVQSQWQYFEQQLHKRRRSYVKPIG